MPASAAVPVASSASRGVRRIRLTKLAIVPVLALAILSAHVYAEEGVIDTSLEVAGYLLLIVAAMGRVWSAAFISGRKARELVVDGPYSIVRNPLYFFSFVGFVGAGLAFESLTIAAGLGLVFFLTHWGTIHREEDRLRGIFGQTFDAYVAEVPRFLPRPWLLRNPETVTMSPKVFSRAVVACSLVACVWLAAHALEWAHAHKALPVVFLLP